MLPRTHFPRPLCAVLAAVFCFAIAVNPGAQSAAADPLKDTTSLKFVPDDAAFYSASFRMKEQFDGFLKSNAYARLKTMPVFQMAMGAIQLQLQTSPFGAELAKAENKELLKLLGEMVSHEIFVYGDNQCAELIDLFMLMNSANQVGQYEALLEGNPAGGSSDPRRMLQVLQKNRARLKAPNLVIGFKVNDTRAATTQIARLKTVIEAQLAAQPKLKKRFRKTKVAGRDYLTLSLDGTLIPWDEVPIKEFEKEDGDFQELIDHLKNVKLTVSLGVRNNYVLLAVGETTDVLKTLESGKPLYDRKEFAPLRKFTDRPITSVSYTSQRLAQSAGGSTRQIDQFIDLAEKAIEKSHVDAKVKAEFRADVKKIRKYLKDSQPDPGAKMSFSFRTSRGIEGYAWDWSKNDSLDDSKKLSLLGHVGGTPIAFVIARSKYNPDQYAAFASTMQRAFYYGEKVLLEKLSAEERAQYQRVRKIAVPLIVRLHKANRDLLIPALKDGQSGFVLDAKIKSRRWFAQMPPPGKALPMFELGLIFGVSDAEKLKKGCNEYYAVAKKILEAVRREVPGPLPPIDLPQPKTTKTAAGTIYRLPLPPKLGIDEQIAPVAGLSRSIAVLSTSPKMAERILDRNPLTLPEGLLSDRNRTLATASYFNFPALLDAVSPWVDYAVREYFRLQLPAGEAPDAQADAILGQVRTGVEILKCFRGSSSARYRQGKAMVTHTETVWRDLKK